MSRLVYLVTDPITADSFLRGHLDYLRHEGFDVHLVSAPGPLLQRVAEATGVTAHAVPLRREIRPWADASALFRLTALLRRLAPDLVNCSTPKAGLLGLLAARWANVPHRLYLVRGLRLETSRGLKRWLLTIAERWASRAATRTFCVSASLGQRYRDLRLGRHPVAGHEDQPPKVFGHGSSNGVSMDRFSAARQASTRGTVRRALGLPPDAPVVGFVGRLTHDKGIRDLVTAFTEIVRPSLPQAWLVLLGAFETGDPVDRATRQRIEAETTIIVRPFVPELSDEYAAFDVVAFPSYREGFPNVPLEAAACGLPVAGYKATGTVDAVIDGLTGTLVDVGDSGALGRALLAYLKSPELRHSHGAAGLERASRDFKPDEIWQAWRDEYRQLLRMAG